jgi:alpha-beta hydrolase superfamily lysophospholipase
VAGDHREDTFVGVGGVTLYWQAWAPVEPPRASVVLAHGLGEHGGRYADLAGRLVEVGYSVFALDHRSHGRSGGRRAQFGPASDLVDDFETFVTTVVEPTADGPLFVLGHSLGGWVAAEYARRRQASLAGLVLSSPLAELEVGPPPLPTLVRGLAKVTPRLGLARIDSDTVSRDPAQVRAYDEDPLVFHGRLPAQTVAALDAAVNRPDDELPRLTLPLLVIHGTADELVPSRCGQKMFDQATGEDKTLKLYDGCRHELFNEVAEVRERVTGDVLAWLDPRSDPAG